MKTATFIFLFCSQLSLAQNVLLVLKSGQRFSTKITATSNSALFTLQGSHFYASVDSAIFELKDQKNQEIYDRLQYNLIKISFTGYKTDYQIVKANTPPPDVYLMLDKFAKQRTAGKALQLLGVAAVGLAFLSKDADTFKAISIGGVAVSSIGFIVDMDASKHLRLKGVR